MASTMSSVSTSKTERNWSCGNCTFSNSINKVSCEVCGIPNSAKHVYPGMIVQVKLMFNKQNNIQNTNCL